MKVVYLWLTMGPYHIARMNAVSRILGSNNVHIIEIVPKDDHHWETQSFTKNFIYYSCLPDEILSHQSIKNAIPILKEILNKIEFDIIINGCGYFDIHLYKFLKKYYKSSKLLLWSESTIQDNPNPWYKLLLKKWLTKIYNGALVAGQLHMEMLLKIGFKAESIQIVGNVVDNSYYSNDNLLKEKKNYLFVGRLLSIKNVETLIYAFELCVKNGSDWNLTIVGDGEERNRLVGLVKRLNLTDKIQFSGLVQADRLRELYQEHSVFILPSLSEPWGLVVNEAMASGLPVILSSKCGSVEMIEHEKSGYIFDPHNKSQLAEFMLKLEFDKQLRNQFVEQSKERIKKYSTEIYATNTVNYFKKIIANE